MWGKSLIAFILGVAAAPYVKKYGKPILKEAVKKSVVTGMQLQKLAAETKEDMEDWAAEATEQAKSEQGQPH